MKFIGGSLLGLSLGTFSYSYLVESKSFGVTELDIALGLGLRAVQISDTHIDTSVYNLHDLIDLVGSLRPEIIFYTGDLLTTVKGLEDSITFLLSLGELAEVYFVLGNHDIWSGLTASQLRDLVHTSNNIFVLDNESVYHDGFWIIGVNDPYTYNSDLNKALQGVDGSGPKVLLAHSPQIIGEAAGEVDVVLAGHTHGGQIRLPFIGPLWLPLPPKYLKYDYGLFMVSNTRMFVTRGVGTTFLPVRFNCPPEIVLLRL